MTVTTNGHDVNELARRDAAAGASRADLMERYGRSNGWAGNMIRQARANGNGAVVARPKPAVTRTTARRQIPKNADLKYSKDADDRLEKWTRRAAAYGLSAIALAMSYSHTKSLVVTAGVSWPALMPLTVDLLMVVGWLCRRRHPGDVMATVAVVTGVAGSLALNALAARPELVATDDVRLWTYLAVPTAAVLAVHLALKR